jgi:hypothetical protein
MDLITQNSQNFHTTVLQLLALNHPHVSIPNIFTFLCCLSKMRNEKLFNNLDGQPSQVIIRANALLNSLQIHKAPTLPEKNACNSSGAVILWPKDLCGCSLEEESKWTTI